MPQEKLQQLKEELKEMEEAELGLGVPGKLFWMRECWDRYIRDENYFHSTIAYIHKGIDSNPKPS